MNIYNAEPYGYSPGAIKLWESNGYSYRAGSWEEIEKTDSFPGVHILIVRLQKKVNEEILSRFPDLRYVISATTGHDHLDIPEIEKRNVKLISLRPHPEFLETIPSTAEHTWGLLLSLMRNIPAACNDVINGNWNRDAFRGYELKNKTIGIIGMGRTGKKVARYASAFGMRIIYSDPNVSQAENGTRVALEKLLSDSDIITLHVHLTPETVHLIAEREIVAMKKNVFLVNTSRGKIWDENAITTALRNGNISGIATDVLSDEFGKIENTPIWKCAKDGHNVIITPHIGGATWDAMHTCEEFCCKLIIG